MERYGRSGHSLRWIDWWYVFFHMKGPCYWLVYFIIFLVVLSFGLLSLWTCQHQLSNWCRLPGPSDWWMKIPCWLPKEHGDKLLLVYIVVYLGPFSRNKNHRAYYCSKFFFAVLDILQINPSLIENCRDFLNFFWRTKLKLKQLEMKIITSYVPCLND